LPGGDSFLLPFLGLHIHAFFDGRMANCDFLAAKGQAAGDDSTISAVAFLAGRFKSTRGAAGGGTAGGSSSSSQWMAKRSRPTWIVIVRTAGSSDGFGNGNTFFWRFFMTTFMPPLPGKGKFPFI
jgi:hypothetical protein